jgi:hypothetical protein
MATDGNFMGLGIYVKRGQKMDQLQDELDQAVAAKKSFIFKARLTPLRTWPSRWGYRSKS